MIEGLAVNIPRVRRQMIADRRRQILIATIRHFTHIPANRIHVMRSGLLTFFRRGITLSGGQHAVTPLSTTAQAIVSTLAAQ